MEGTIGETRMFAGLLIPRFWAACDGRELGVRDYPELFTLLGFAHGGDNVSKFRLPNMPDVVPGVKYMICLQGQGSAPAR
jgi:microcystin-dependent protein